MTCILPSAYLAPISHYSLLASHEVVWTEVCDTYSRETLRNRCVIASSGGRQTLSVPVEKPTGKTMTKDVRVSEHGHWRHVHWNALRSAYGRSPYFEYYADLIEPLYSRRWTFLVDLNEAMQLTLCHLLGLTPTVHRTLTYAHHPPMHDYRSLVSPLSSHSLNLSSVLPHETAPYPQVFASHHGFLPGLSIVDLLFNMGPESLTLL